MYFQHLFNLFYKLIPFSHLKVEVFQNFLQLNTSTFVWMVIEFKVWIH